MEVQHLAIASIPLQTWGPVYDKQTALKKGTVFQELDMPFFAADEGNAGCCSKGSGTGDPQQQEREEKMMQIYQVCFAVDDLKLYLDTHPQDSQALELLKSNLVQRSQLLKDFAQKFFPLTMDCMAHLCQMGACGNCYGWQEGPMPWEGACV